MKEETKKTLHTRIWLQGFMAAFIFAILMWVFDQEKYVFQVILEFFTFLFTWVIIHYIVNRNKFKNLS
ncbi:MAG: hypothetical protein ACOC1L_00670 [Bacillota bacterium]